VEIRRGGDHGLEASVAEEMWRRGGHWGVTRPGGRRRRVASNRAAGRHPREAGRGLADHTRQGAATPRRTWRAAGGEPRVAGAGGSGGQTLAACSGSNRGRGGRRACARCRDPQHHAVEPSGSRAQHARASGTRARRASTRAARARAAGIRRRSLGLPEVQLGQGRQPVGRRNRGDRWGAGITRAAGGRTAEEVGRARQGGG